MIRVRPVVLLRPWKSGRPFTMDLLSGVPSPPNPASVQWLNEKAKDVHTVQVGNLLEGVGSYGTGRLLYSF